MKKLLCSLILMLACSSYGQSIKANFFTTNINQVALGITNNLVATNDTRLLTLSNSTMVLNRQPLVADLTTGFRIGRQNMAVGDISGVFMFGENNVLDSQGGSSVVNIVGFGNTVTNGSSISILGDNNVVDTSIDQAILGTQNKLTGDVDQRFALGFFNTVSSGYSGAIGDNLTNTVNYTIDIGASDPTKTTFSLTGVVFRTPLFATNSHLRGLTLVGPITNTYPGNLITHHINDGAGAIAERGKWSDKVGGQGWDFYALGDDFTVSNRWMGLTRTGSVPSVSEIVFDAPIFGNAGKLTVLTVTNAALTGVNTTVITGGGVGTTNGANNAGITNGNIWASGTITMANGTATGNFSVPNGTLTTYNLSAGGYTLTTLRPNSASLDLGTTADRWRRGYFLTEVISALFTGNGAGLSNAVNIVAGLGTTVVPSGEFRTFTIIATNSPLIVFSDKLTGLTGSAGATSFPGITGGAFSRVTGCATIDTPATAGTLSVTIAGSTSAGAWSQTTAAITITGGGTIVPFVFACPGTNTALTYATTFSGTAGPLSYSLELEVETLRK